MIPQELILGRLSVLLSRLCQAQRKSVTCHSTASRMSHQTAELFISGGPHLLISFLPYPVIGVEMLEAGPPPLPFRMRYIRKIIPLNARNHLNCK